MEQVVTEVVAPEWLPIEMKTEKKDLPEVVSEVSSEETEVEVSQEKLKILDLLEADSEVISEVDSEVEVKTEASEEAVASVKIDLSEVVKTDPSEAVKTDLSGIEEKEKTDSKTEVVTGSKAEEIALKVEVTASKEGEIDSEIERIDLVIEKAEEVECQVSQ